MRNIVMARIDERLIHGQVATSWLGFTKPNVIAVVDDKTVTDSFMQMILKACCPRECQLLIMTAQQGSDYLKEDGPANERVFVITKGPEAMLTMIRNGIRFEEIILGNIGMGPGRKRFNKNVSASDQEVQCFRDIIAEGVNIYQQMVFTDSKVDISKILK